MRLRLCGTRGSTPAPGVDFARYGGQTSCVAVVSDDGECRLILDAGTSLRRLPAALHGQPFNGTILLTHLHWDHTHGLPFCPAVDNPDARTTLYIPEQPGGDAEEILARAMSPPHFPIRPREMRGLWEFRHLPSGEHHIEGFHVLALEIPHKGGRTFGYRVSDDRVAIAYLPDHAPISLGPGPEQHGPYHETAVQLTWTFCCTIRSTREKNSPHERTSGTPASMTPWVLRHTPERGSWSSSITTHGGRTRNSTASSRAGPGPPCL